MKAREEAFDLSFATAKKDEYNGLFDRNLRAYFDSRNVQGILHKVGMVRATLA
jgi:hypothetical protein